MAKGKLYDGENCPCKAVTCKYHGDCKSCRKKHHEHGGQTYCERVAAGGKNVDDDFAFG